MAAAAFEKIAKGLGSFLGKRERKAGDQEQREEHEGVAAGSVASVDETVHQETHTYSWLYFFLWLQMLEYFALPATHIHSSRNRISSLPTGLSRPPVRASTHAGQPASKKPSHRRIVFRPYDQKDMLNRLETFRPLTWFSKPEIVGPIACASRG